MFVYLDTETTGLNPLRHQVWEMAWALDDGPVNSAVVPHTLDNADPRALEINRYHERWDRANLRDIEQPLRAAIQGQTLVAANPAFDAAFLQSRWGCWGNAPWKYRMLDIEAYAAGVLGWDKPYGLATIAEELGIEPGDHTAEQDVRCLRECHKRLSARSLNQNWA